MSLVKLINRTFHSLTSDKLVGLMFLCAGLAVVVVVALISGITWLTAHFVSLKWGWLDTLINWTVGFASGIGGWFMLPVLVVLISGVFQEVTIYRVEKAEYPDRLRTQEPHLWPDIMHDVRFTLKALVLNILVLPFYFFGIGFVLSIMLNSYLLGREFFESAAGHHLGKPRARELGRKNRKIVYGSGFVLTMLTLVPVANLFAPIIAIVWMVHVFHGLEGNGASL